ncbi:hypothetical protein QW131_29130 [Roseibium salinum]|nr:hypothetical protein [Roseibium salinum]
MLESDLQRAGAYAGRGSDIRQPDGPVHVLMHEIDGLLDMPRHDVNETLAQISAEAVLAVLQNKPYDSLRHERHGLRRVLQDAFGRQSLRHGSAYGNQGPSDRRAQIDERPDPELTKRGELEHVVETGVHQRSVEK